MSTTKRCLIVPAALLAMIAMSSNAAAQCDTTAGSSAAGSCGDCGTHGAGGFGYPGNADCAGGSHSVLQNIHQGIETYKADYRLNRARASAWPKPFSCWDREHYYAILNQQYATGMAVAHTLTSEYFNSESNKLNRAGELRVAWIMQNAPQADKQIFVYEDQTGPTMDQRMDSIREFTNRYYGHLGNAAIAKSQILPHQIPATYQASYLQAYQEGQPAPIIPIMSGQTINTTVGQ